MARTVRYMAAILWLLSVIGYAQPVHILHKPYRIDYEYIDSLKVKSDDPAIASPAKMLEHLKKTEAWAREKGDEQLADELKLWRFHYRLFLNDSTVTLQELEDAAMEARQKKDKYAEVNALEVLAGYFYMYKKFGLSFEKHLAAYNIYSNFTSSEFPPKREYLYILGGQYARNGDASNAVKMFKEAYDATKEDFFTNAISNSLGVEYRKLKNYDSAIVYFEKVYKDAVVQNDSPWIGISAGNIGICYYEQGKYDMAVPLIERDITLSMQTRQIKNGVHSMWVLANIYRKRGENDKAEQLLMRGLHESEIRNFWPDYQLAAELYDLMARISFEKNKTRDAYLYLDSATVAKDSIAVGFNEANILRAKDKLETVQHQMQLQAMERERRGQLAIRNSLILIILLVAISGVLYVNGLKQKRKKLEAEKKNAEADLDMARMQLNNFKQSVQEKNRIIEQVTTEMTSLRRDETEAINNEAIQRLEGSILLTDEQWEEFRVLFEKVHSGFFRRVKEKMPDLTPAELRFVALSKLKLSPKEMASMLGISSNSIRNYRHRLRRKLNLDEDASIEEIADAI